MTLKKLAKGMLFLCLALFSTMAYAQNKEISGTVTDSKDSSAIPGISVLAVSSTGKKSGVPTSSDGSFRISLADNIVKLIVTGAGYERQEINVAGKTTVNVVLVSANQSLNEVVVIGYGTARKRDLTGAVGTVKSKDFNQGIITAPDQLLQNKVAGLEITSNSGGDPGGATTIKIRGNSSIRASQSPLYVIDGVPLDGGTAFPGTNTGAFGNTPGSNPLLYVNPNDIAQIDVLKDASSSAIYGSRGANGVVVITTKKGTSGPMKLDFGTSFGFYGGFMKKYKVLDASQFRNALTKYGLVAASTNDLDGGTSTDALKAITQNKITQNYSLAFSGGNETGKFRASFLASSTPGFLKKSKLDKYLGSFNGQYKFLENKLSFDFGLTAGSVTRDLTSVSNNAGSTGNLLTSALSWNPTQPLYLSSGLYNLSKNGTANPLALSDAYSDRSRLNAILGNISAGYKLLKNLEYKFLYGINYQTGSRDVNVEGWLVGFPGLSGQGQAAIGNASLTSQIFTHTLNYNTNLSAKLKFDAVGGYEYYKSDYVNSGVTGSGFNTNLDQANRISIPYTAIFANAKTQTPFSTGVNPTTEIQSYFARANFNFDDKYLLTGTFRADGSSKFGSDNRYGYFPSVGGKWVINNEAFMKDSKVFSTLSLRGSWGKTGNQEYPAGSSQEQFGLPSYNTAPQVVNGNKSLKWETTTAYNIGTDFSFGKGRVYGSVDYYNKTTKDILFQTVAIQPAPSSVSFVNLPGANLINKGVEVALGASIIDKKNFGWDVNVNFAYNKNVIKKFTDPLTGLNLSIQTGTIDGQGVSGTLAQVITNNYPVNEYYLKTFGGFDSKGNQIISDNPTYQGDPNPHSLFGLSTSVRYEKFTFSLNMGGAAGFLIYNNTATSVTNINGITSGRNIDLAAYNSGEGKSSGAGASSRFLEKGDYLKLRNVTVRYMIGNTGRYIKNLSAFVSGSNLLVITKFNGFDPEVNVDKSSGAYPSRSIEYVPYPTPRSVSFGLNFSL